MSNSVRSQDRHTLIENIISTPRIWIAACLRLNLEVNLIYRSVSAWTPKYGEYGEYPDLVYTVYPRQNQHHASSVFFLIYIYIYIYICVCVCVCVCKKKILNGWK